MKALRLAVIVMMLTGCAALEPLTLESELQVAELVELGEYGRALTALERLLERDPGNETLRAQHRDVQQRATQLEQSILIEAATHLRVEDWARARERYEHGLAVLPNSEALQAAHAAFETERRHHLRALRMRLLLARGHSLIRERPLYEELHRVSPGNYRARIQYQRAERDAREVAAELMELGEAALTADDPLLAVEALTLAHALAPMGDTARRLQEAEAAQQARLEALHEIPPAPESPEPNGWTAQDQALLERYHQAFRSGDLALARQLLDALWQRHPGRDDLQSQRPPLSRAIETRVSAGLERGLRLYAQGRIDDALAVWRPLRELAPDHRELEAHVERAERVRKRLEELK